MSIDICTNFNLLTDMLAYICVYISFLFGCVYLICDFLLTATDCSVNKVHITFIPVA